MPATFSPVHANDLNIAAVHCMSLEPGVLNIHTEFWKLRSALQNSVCLLSVCFCWSFIDPTFWGIFVCVPLQFKCVELHCGTRLVFMLRSKLVPRTVPSVQFDTPPTNVVRKLKKNSEFFFRFVLICALDLVFSFWLFSLGEIKVCQIEMSYQPFISGLPWGRRCWLCACILFSFGCAALEANNPWSVRNLNSDMRA